jgi:AcrR family transcriptional regulator
MPASMLTAFSLPPEVDCVNISWHEARVAYHHGNLRAALVEAATALLEDGGPLGVTLRGAARRAGVSQTAPYRHFPDKGALLAAVAEQGFRRLGAAMARAARPHGADPVGALEAMAIALVHFADRHGAHYRLMSGPAVRGRDHPALREAALAAWGLLTTTVTACQRAGRIRAGDPAAFAFVLWSLVHGLSTLLVDEQIPPIVRQTWLPAELAKKSTQVLLEGLAGPRSTRPGRTASPTLSPRSRRRRRARRP